MWTCSSSYRKNKKKTSTHTHTYDYPSNASKSRIIWQHLYQNVITRCHHQHHCTYEEYCNVDCESITKWSLHWRFAPFFILNSGWWAFVVVFSLFHMIQSIEKYLDMMHVKQFTLWHNIYFSFWMFHFLYFSHRILTRPWSLWTHTNIK